MNEPPPVVVLVSGQGTNLQAIIDAIQAGKLRAQIALVVSNRPEAYALQRATQAKIPTLCLPRSEYPTREAFEDRLLHDLAATKPAAIVLAGFDRLISSRFVSTYKNRILNIHPALLPSFPGLHAAKQALDYGVKVTGVTIHIVDEGMDTGPIILQEAVPIYDDDTEETLLERIHALEHRLYPEAIGLLVDKRLEIDGRVVRRL